MLPNNAILFLISVRISFIGLNFVRITDCRIFLLKGLQLWAQGFSCVAYFRCSTDGVIVDDGAGLIDIRSSGQPSASEGKSCEQDTEICCRDKRFPVATPVLALEGEKLEVPALGPLS